LAVGGLNFLLPKKYSTQMTFLELRAQFKNVEEDWINRLKALNYENLEDAWNSKTELHRKGMAWMIEFLGIHIFQHLVYTLDMKEMDWQDKLFYLITNEDKLDLIKIRVEELKTYFEQSKKNSLDPAFYLDNICGVGFPHLVFNNLPEPSQRRIMEKTKNDFNELEISRFVYGEIYEFAELNASIIEFMYIKTLVDKFTFGGNAQKNLDRTESSNISKNEYPKFFKNEYAKVFRNGYATELFNFLLTEEDKPIGPSWAGKYFLLFKEEKLIKPKAKPVNFLTYLNKNIPKKIQILDNRTGYKEDVEVDFFKEVEKKFQILNDVKRP
jgi:hypothetical protein